MKTTTFSARARAKLLAGLAGAATLALLPLLGCSSIPGDTGEEQAEAIDDLVQRTLQDLYEQEPGTQEAIAQSVGYVVMSNKTTKIPVVGVGSGYGVAIENPSGARTYLKLSRFDVGGGWGARKLRPVLIFQDREAFQDLIEGTWETRVGAEAAAKVGDAGAAGSGSSAALTDKGYSVHVLTDAGVSATVTAGILRVKPVKLKD